MYITTSHNPDILDTGAAFLTWPGHKLLAHLPDNPDASWDHDALQDRFLTFDFLVSPSGQLEMVRQMVLRIQHYPSGNAHPSPLLFCPETLKIEVIDDLLARAEEDPWIVEAAFLDEGRFDFLLLGKNVVESPLFITFFNNLAPGMTDFFSKEAVDVIRQHLVAKDTNS